MCFTRHVVPDLLPIRTDRLVVRALRDDDLPALVAYRNDPDVARYQDWALPYSPAAGAALLDRQRGTTGPRPGEAAQLAIDDGTGLVGDLYVDIALDDRSATIGYTLARSAQGRGYAVEAVRALLDRLVDDLGVRRITASLDPENVASMRLLERLGFRYEGTAVAAVEIRGEWLDDDRYAILDDEWRAHRARTLVPPERVELVEITDENVRRVSRLATHRSQRRFVATVAESLADALVPEVVDGAPVVPWFRAIAADGEPVGFVMIAETTEHHPEPYLWRLLVDHHHQRRGIGERALVLLAERLAASGAPALLTSWVDGPGGPEPFYRGLGFEPTGRIVDGEIEGRAPLERLLGRR
jgi:RimJ/RimL family protein N-acetyltransferase